MICSVEGCDNESARRGMCHKHYKRFRVHGDVNHVEKIYDHPEKCTVEGCENPYVTMGYCNRHYLTYMKYGDALYKTRIHEDHENKRYPEYSVWAGMKARCNNVNHNAYFRYGGRGVKVCESWSRSFLAFYKDMGQRPTKKHQIDRIDPNGNYEPANCRWVTNAENCQNRRNTKLTKEIVQEIRSEHDKGRLTHQDLANEYGVVKGHITAIVNNHKWKNA